MELRFKSLSWLLWNAIFGTSSLSKVVEQTKVSKDLIEWIDKGYKVITLLQAVALC